MPRRVVSWARVARSWVAPLVPRVLALGWAVWVVSTAWAYRDGAPLQLQGVENFVGVPIWSMWAVSAACLIVGALIPPRVGHPWQRIGSQLRGIGLLVSIALLGVWAVEFYSTDGRGWVTGKNYAWMAVIALTHAWYIGRNRAPSRVRGAQGGDADGDHHRVD